MKKVMTSYVLGLLTPIAVMAMIAVAGDQGRVKLPLPGAMGSWYLIAQPELPIAVQLGTKPGLRSFVDIGCPVGDRIEVIRVRTTDHGRLKTKPVLAVQPPKPMDTGVSRIVFENKGDPGDPSDYVGLDINASCWPG